MRCAPDEAGGGPPPDGCARPRTDAPGAGPGEFVVRLVGAAGGGHGGGAGARAGGGPLARTRLIIEPDGV